MVYLARIELALTTCFRSRFTNQPKIHGARGGTRTLTFFKTTGFKSVEATITPHSHKKTK